MVDDLFNLHPNITSLNCQELVIHSLFFSQIYNFIYSFQSLIDVISNLEIQSNKMLF